MRTIIDTHLHTWDVEQLSYYWLSEDVGQLNRTYLLDEVEQEFNSTGINAAILVQATNSLDETDWLLKLAERFNWIVGTVVWLPLQEPQQVQELLNIYLKNPFFKGVRHQIHDEANPAWLLQSNILESLKLIADANIPYDLVGVKTAHIATALEVADKIPNLKMVFDHLNQLPVDQNISSIEWHHLLSAAANNPNFFAKISGLGTAIKKSGWAAADIRPYTDFIFEKFGTSRVLCGSDWPVSLLAGSYSYTWKQYVEVVESSVNKAEQDNIFYKNAESFYNVKHI